MTDPTPAADRIRAAIQRCIDASAAPPTTDDIAAAVLMEAAAALFPEEPEPIEPERMATRRETRRAWLRHSLDWGRWNALQLAGERLQALAQQLNGTDPIRGVPPLLADLLSQRHPAPVPVAVSEGREPASVVKEPSDEELLATLDKATAAFPPRHPEAESLNAVEYPLALELRKARAVLARFGRHSPDATKMVGPAEGDVAELVGWLRENAEDERQMCESSNRASLNLERAADLLEAQAALAQQLNGTDYGDPTA